MAAQTPVFKEHGVAMALPTPRQGQRVWTSIQMRRGAGPSPQCPSHTLHVRVRALIFLGKDLILAKNAELGLWKGKTQGEHSSTRAEQAHWCGYGEAWGSLVCLSHLSSHRLLLPVAASISPRCTVQTLPTCTTT